LPLDSDPGSEFPIRIHKVIESGSNQETDPDQIRKRILIKSGNGSGSTTLVLHTRHVYRYGYSTGLCSGSVGFLSSCIWIRKFFCTDSDSVPDTCLICYKRIPVLGSFCREFCNRFRVSGSPIGGPTKCWILESDQQRRRGIKIMRLRNAGTHSDLLYLMVLKRISKLL
jgi:hypothetical protein